MSWSYLLWGIAVVVPAVSWTVYLVIAWRYRKWSRPRVDEPWPVVPTVVAVVFIAPVALLFSLWIAPHWQHVIDNNIKRCEFRGGTWIDYAWHKDKCEYVPDSNINIGR